MWFSNQRMAGRSYRWWGTHRPSLVFIGASQGQKSELRSKLNMVKKELKKDSVLFFSQTKDSRKGFSFYLVLAFSTDIPRKCGSRVISGGFYPQLNYSAFDFYHLRGALRAFPRANAWRAVSILHESSPSLGQLRARIRA